MLIFGHVANNDRAWLPSSSVPPRPIICSANGGNDAQEDQRRIIVRVIASVSRDHEGRASIVLF